ncbi:hypothetical protein D3C87_1975360 [compost metagenome]
MFRSVEVADTTSGAAVSLATVKSVAAEPTLNVAKSVTPAAVKLCVPTVRLVEIIATFG